MPDTFPTIKMVQKDYTRVDGSQNIFLRFTIKRKVKYFPLNIYVKPNRFKPEKDESISRSDPDHKEKNILLDHYYLKAKKILFDHRLQNKNLTLNIFIQNFSNASFGNNSFFDFTDRQLSLLKGTMAPNTIKNYVSQFEKLKEFKPELSFDDIDLDFITKYVGYIKQKKNNNKNTVIKSVKVIKTFLNRAVDQKIIKENAIKSYKLGTIEGNREFLSISELAVIESLHNKNSLIPSKSNILRYFLFSCYTGLRYQDIKDLRFQDIIDNKTISIQMTKTKDFVKIPLIEKARNLIPPKGFDKQTVFRVISGQATNKYLKEIMKEAGINKQITFHCARHTFATVSKSHGVPYDVISKILGHTDIKTTKIYTKYEIELLTREMEKWDKNKS